MKMKKWLAAGLALCLMVSLAACGTTGAAVYVQSVAQLAGSGLLSPGDRFPGMVVSENVTDLKRDMDKTVAELLVKAGEDVTAGQPLFSYDTDELKLTLDKKRLELEQLDATIENYKEQIQDLEEDRYNAPSSEELQYTVQIQTLQVDLKEAELNRVAKETEIQQSEAILENAVVVSPIDGRVQSVNENGTDNYGNPLPYIVIQQAGSYRIKASLGELQRGAIMEGTRMKICSRTDGRTWAGTVTLVDYENASQGNNNDMYFGMQADPMTSSSKYPFYVELDSTDGLMLGQHVYLTADSGEEEATGVLLSSGFLCYEEDGSTYVWAEKSGKLEKRAVTLGDYNGMMDAFQILEGLTEQDYVAFPSDLCQEGAATTREEPKEEGPRPENGPMEVG